MSAPDQQSSASPTGEPSDAGPWLVRHAPPPDLAPFVKAIVGYRETGRGLAGAVEMAPLTIPLIFGFSGHFEIALDRTPSPQDRYGSFVSGLHPGFVTMNSAGDAECLQVDFTPLGAYRFFARPMSDLAGRMLGLDDYGDADMRAIFERLGEETDWRRRFEMVEWLVRMRIAAARAPSACVEEAIARIRRSSGEIRVDELARRAGISRKHMNERFRAEVGIGAKSFARMVRFNRALGMSRQQPRAGWAMIAAECGYADQSHLVREFVRFSGATPTA